MKGQIVDFDSRECLPYQDCGRLKTRWAGAVTLETSQWRRPSILAGRREHGSYTRRRINR